MTISHKSDFSTWNNTQNNFSSKFGPHIFFLKDKKKIIYKKNIGYKKKTISDIFFNFDFSILTKKIKIFDFFSETFFQKFRDFQDFVMIFFFLIEENRWYILSLMIWFRAKHILHLLIYRIAHSTFIFISYLITRIAHIIYINFTCSAHCFY